MDRATSEIARLRQQITEELESMQHGFSGFASGVSRHDFIRTRMERIGDHQDRLAEHVGTGDAVQIVCELYMKTIDKEEKKKF